MISCTLNMSIFLKFLLRWSFLVISCLLNLLSFCHLWLRYQGLTVLEMIVVFNFIRRKLCCLLSWLLIFCLISRLLSWFSSTLLLYWQHITVIVVLKVNKASGRQILAWLKIIALCCNLGGRGLMLLAMGSHFFLIFGLGCWVLLEATNLLLFAYPIGDVSNFEVVEHTMLL